MATYFGLWKANTSLPPPPTPAEQIKQQEGFDALLRGQLKSGRLREVHAFLEGGAGYFITGDVTEEQAFEELAGWGPHVSVALPRPLPVPNAVQIVLRALSKWARKT